MGKRAGNPEIDPDKLHDLYKKLGQIQRHYGYDPAEWDDQNPKAWFHLLLLTIRDFAKIPAADNRGADPIWIGDIGFKVVADIEKIRLEYLGNKKLTDIEAIKLLQAGRWADECPQLLQYDPDYVREQYVKRARKRWGYLARLKKIFGHK